jgi:hypothetical protein
MQCLCLCRVVLNLLARFFKTFRSIAPVTAAVYGQKRNGYETRMLSTATIVQKHTWVADQEQAHEDGDAEELQAPQAAGLGC